VANRASDDDDCGFVVAHVRGEHASVERMETDAAPPPPERGDRERQPSEAHTRGVADRRGRPEDREKSPGERRRGSDGKRSHEPEAESQGEDVLGYAGRQPV
jgi:hypothetical protein